MANHEQETIDDLEEKSNPLFNLLQVDFFAECASTLADSELDLLIERLGSLKSDMEALKLVRTKQNKLKEGTNLIRQDTFVALPKITPNLACPPLLASQPSPSIPSEVLRQILRRDFLTYQELGRLLLFVSKIILVDIEEEEIWSNLCRRRWRNSKHMPSSVVQQRGFKWLFSQLTLGLPIRKDHDWSSLPPSPKITSENMFFLITIRPKDGDEEVISIALQQAPLDQLLSTGKTHVELETPYRIGEFDMAEYDLPGDFLDENMFNTWTASVHCLRLDENRCCCLHDTRDRFLDENCGGAPSKDQISNLRFCTDVMELRNQWDGSIGNRIREDNSKDELFGGYKLELDLLCFKRTTKEALDEAKVLLQFTHLKLQFWRRYYGRHGNPFHREWGKPKNGILLNHILDELYGWEL